MIMCILIVCSVLKKVLKYFYNSDVTLACEDVSSTTHKLILSQVVTVNVKNTFLQFLAMVFTGNVFDKIVRSHQSLVHVGMS